MLKIISIIYIKQKFSEHAEKELQEKKLQEKNL